MGWIEMKGPRLMIAGIVFVILLCLAAGCTGFAAPGSASGQGSSGSGGGSGGGGSGSGSSGSYPENSYFTFDCSGTWKSSNDPAWMNHNGKFTVTGSVPFPITYDYNLIGYGLYTDVNAGRSDKSNPLRIKGESQECMGTKDDCKLCHYVFDGEIYAGGVMVYNRSESSGRRWTVSFARMPGGENGIWHTNSVTQTEAGCPVTEVEKVGPSEIAESSYACFNENEGQDTAIPFEFSDGSGFDVSPHAEPGDYQFTSLSPHVVFHLGKAPS